MVDEDDPLDRLIPSSAKRSKSDESPSRSPDTDGAENAADSGESGINPLDLVELPDSEREILNWLSRRRKARIGEIQEALDISSDELEKALDQFTENSQVQLTQEGEDIYYRVVFKGKATRRLKGFPEDLWKRAGIDDD